MVAEVGEVIDPARSVADLYEDGEIRGFEFRQIGEAIGQSFGR